MRIVRTLEKEPWNRFLEQHPHATIYHTPEMFQAFARAPGHLPQLWAAVADDQVLALFTPVRITLMNGLLRDFTTRAVSYGGLLCAPGDQGAAAGALLLQEYATRVESSVLFTELRNQVDTTDLQPLFKRKCYVFEDHLNFLIDLEQTEEQLWGKIRKNGRYSIRAAERKGVRVQEATDPGAMRVAYRKLQQVYTRVGVPLADIALFQAACEILGPRGMLKIFQACVGGECIGAMLVLVYKDRVIDWYAGGDREMSALYAPNESLVWHALRWGKANGYAIFDFGGGGNPHQPYGPREFKIKFGGARVNYGRNICVHAQLRLAVSQAGYDLLRRLPRRAHAVETAEV